MIAIYGGSFDPPHRGHLGVIQKFWKLFPESKELLIIPNYISPFKKAKGVDEKHLLDMLSILIQENQILNTKIEEFEIRKKKPSYTIDTVLEIQNRYPKEEIQLIIGMDNLTKFSLWKDYKKILEIARLLVFDRDITDNREYPEELGIYRDRIFIVSDFKIDASSSEIREMDRTRWNEYITPEVLSYIKNEKLYGY
ncbi:MAG TPA: nicotinate (nicotinamide) nucleotide adenylyltransferase [Leptospiraceae bacterium]|nr:nicotinate (nicotinamide) nucleotide adenylyltransferase [Leptospiraceae bacterium]HMW06995.1 nicotinate (nicotinamide) nucleotide adenylyltransferase [Leptospiraceae bacterium]HMX32664.1 nicotinate (nicotinamide) nucleotide adenylyltransferase [Leptospiraceae bacterium]HMY30357.1 nicotinate (nicotinamide) nucleotide adenylyltransferase [Leptospiraceae bacterium]HMZ65871.1 nicotinate (nicotinamide) nucleotide adenylyltransferase [Leptospiraceae bacterium]